MAVIDGNVKQTFLRSATQLSTSTQSPRWLGGLYTPVSDIKPVDVWHIISYGPRGETANGHSNTPESPSRDETLSNNTNTNQCVQRVPILGPTRQQTELYFKNLRKKKRRKPGSSHSLDNNRAIRRPDRKSRFDRRSAGNNQHVLKDEVTNSLNVEEDLYTIAGETISMLESNDQFKDLRFISNLARPLRYRIKNGLNKERIIFPSKHGFHPRSHSPTFKRLVGVNEKLQKLEAEGFVFKRVQDPFILTRHSDGLADFYKKSYRLPPPDPNFSKSKVASQTHKGNKLFIPREFPARNNGIVGEKIADDSDYHEQSDNESTDSEIFFKVDNTKDEDNPSQLHLFLPHITDQSNVREETPEVPTTPINSNVTSDRVLLPSILTPRPNNMKQTITNNNQSRTGGMVKNGNVQYRKKKKKVTIRSASADKDKRIQDHLNDVPTLISMNYEDEEHMMNYHTHHRHDSQNNETACPFGENCEVHAKSQVS